MSWDYSSSSDLEALAESIDTLETQGRARAVVMLNEAGLMRLPPELQEIMSLFEAVLPNREAVTNAVVIGLASHPDIVDETWQQTKQHLIHGRDAEDAQSAGGFCSRELEQFTEVMSSVGWQDPRSPTPGLR